jgi:hypothetical protein
MTISFELADEVCSEDELSSYVDQRQEASGPRQETSGFQSMLRAVCFGGAGMLLAGAGPALLHVGTSPMVVDARVAPLPATASISSGPREPAYSRALTLPVAEQAREVMAALALNKKQMAEVLKVTRPTLYAWLDGAEPSPENTVLLMTLLRLMDKSGVQGAEPLNARFVRHRVEEDVPALLELLYAEIWDEGRIARSLTEARMLTAQLDARRQSREDRLRRLGYEEPSEEDRAANLDENLSALDVDNG